MRGGLGGSALASAGALRTIRRGRTPRLPRLLTEPARGCTGTVQHKPGRLGATFVKSSTPDCGAAGGGPPPDAGAAGGDAPGERPAYAPNPGACAMLGAGAAGGDCAAAGGDCAAGALTEGGGFEGDAPMLEPPAAPAAGACGGALLAGALPGDIPAYAPSPGAPAGVLPSLGIAPPDGFFGGGVGCAGSGCDAWGEASLAAALGVLALSWIDGGVFPPGELNCEARFTCSPAAVLARTPPCCTSRASLLYSPRSSRSESSCAARRRASSSASFPSML